MSDASVEEESGQLRTADGRNLAFSCYGPALGHRVVLHYGTPGTRHLSPRIPAAAERAGIRLLVLDRPGYGLSTRLPQRSIADVAADVASATELQGWERFSLWGGSGGGPHALACGCLLADRVDRCAAVVSPAPFGVEGLDWTQGMSPGNVEEFDRAMEGEASYRPLVERLADEAVEAVRAGDVPIPPGYELPEADLAILRARLSDPDQLERTIAAHTEGIDGWIDDALAMVKPWGFDPSDITVPVSIWYGPDDVLVPRSHAEWLLAHIPGSERHELPAGHMLDDAELDAIFGWVIGGKR